MKVQRIYYNDDGILVEGLLITRIFRRPVFYPFESRCGFDSQVIFNKEELVEHTESAYQAFYEKHSSGGR